MRSIPRHIAIFENSSIKINSLENLNSQKSVTFWNTVSNKLLQSSKPNVIFNQKPKQVRLKPFPERSTFQLQEGPQLHQDLSAVGDNRNCS